MRLTLIFITSILLAIGFTSFCQNNNVIDIGGHADCENALIINTTEDFGPTTPPNGYGKLLEIDGNTESDKFYFEKEHNTVWYKIIVPYSGKFVFEIIPQNINDDYDFLLFTLNTNNFCTKIIKEEVQPVRTNISRNDKTINSKTGLNLTSTISFKDSGPGLSYSKYLNVKKGQILYLVVDNVYDNGKGHTIKFDYIKPDGKSAIVHLIEGKILDDENKVPLNAIITIENLNTGEILATAKVENDGTYSFELPKDFKMDDNYNLSVISDKHFFKEMQIVPGKIESEKTEIKIENLKLNKSYQITNINFYPNSPQYLPESKKVLNKIFKMMENNPQMHIEIQGHIDGCKGTDEARKILSEGRAENVKRYLEDKGIEKERISTIGFGCNKMIYPEPNSEEEHKVNRRVEIKITKF